MKNWYSIKAKAEESTAEIAIFDEIGMWGVSAKDFIGDLKNLSGKSITVSINSPGGSVFDALAIYNALRGHGSEITTKAMGIAASAASLIFMAGDKRIMPENAFLMIHNPLVGVYGNADELRDTADVLDTIGASLVKTYVARSNLPEDEIKAMLDAESWLNAEDAVAKGFATEMEAEMKVAASFDTDRLPENIKAVFQASAGEHPNGDGITDADEENQDDGVSDDPIADTLSTQISAAAVKVGMGDFVAVWLLDEQIVNLDMANEAIASAREIRDICNLAGFADKAAAYIRNRSSIAEVRAALSAEMAKQDAATHVSNVVAQPNSTPQNAPHVANVKTAAIWDARRNPVKE